MKPTRISSLKSGQQAPEFSASLDNGTRLASTDLRGKPYILFFYNQDGTETCTREACNLRDHYDALTKAGYLLLGISKDTGKRHTAFKAKYQLPFSLLSDPDHAVARRFDVFGTKVFMGRTSEAVHRTTFVIDARGRIEAVIHPVDAAHHAEQIFALLHQRKS